MKKLTSQELMQIFKEAKHEDDASAQYILAYHYGTQDESVWPHSPEKAFYWLLKAANKKHTGACFALAKCYEWGEGTPSDPDKALFWYNQAMAGGDPDAVWGVERVTERINQRRMYRDAFFGSIILGLIVWLIILSLDYWGV